MVVQEPTRTKWSSPGWLLELAPLAGTGQSRTGELEQQEEVRKADR
jgi:hypothetical protein